ncbi:MAG: phosphoribosylglycinamide formyltransferase-1, partial [Litorivivens sp.]
HEAVLDNGETETGLTVHFVDGEYDTGPILSQRSVKVLANDTVSELSSRVLAEEHDLLVQTLIDLVECD